MPLNGKNVAIPRYCVATALLGAVLGWPLAAAANTPGTLFSGPASGDGASPSSNPAAMTLVAGTEAMVFGAMVPIQLQLQPDTIDPQTGRVRGRQQMSAVSPDVSVGVVTDVGLDWLRFGLGINTPIIDGANWDSTDADGRPALARYYGLFTYLGWLSISPVAALRVNRYLSFGAGIEIHAALLSNSSVLDLGARANQLACADFETGCQLDAPFAREDPVLDASLEASGVGWGVGASFGLLLTPVRWLRIGAMFRTGPGKVSIPISLKLTAPAQLQSFVSQSLPMFAIQPLAAEASIEVSGPMMFATSVQLRGARIVVDFDFQWIDRSSMSTMVGFIHRDETTSSLLTDQVLFNAYRDAYLFGLRGAYLLTSTLRIAAGFSFEPNTRPDAFVAPLTVDLDKFLLRAAVAWRALRWATVVLEYGHYFTLARQVPPNNFRPNPNPTTPEEEALDRPTASGRYWGNADRIGLGLLVQFR